MNISIEISIEISNQILIEISFEILFEISIEISNEISIEILVEILIEISFEIGRPSRSAKTKEKKFPENLKSPKNREDSSDFEDFQTKRIVSVRPIVVFFWKNETSEKISTNWKKSEKFSPIV